MRVVVTGSSGFIGQHTKKALLDGGHNVVEFDLHHRRDVTITGDVERVLEGADAVIHLAGVLGTAELFDAPHVAVDVNVHGTLNILQACEKYGARYVGITMPRVWDNVYQATKQAGRDLASAWHRHRGLQVSHVRAFNAYGQGQKVNGVQKIVPTFATRAWRNEAIPIWGDGQQMVDLVWAGDIGGMLCRALYFGSDNVFDAGTGRGMTVEEVANRIIKHTGSTGGIEWLPMRAGEHSAKVVAEGEGWDLIGYRPAWRRIRFAETVDYYRQDRK